MDNKITLWQKRIFGHSIRIWKFSSIPTRVWNNSVHRPLRAEVSYDK